MPREITHVQTLGGFRLALTFRGGDRREIDIAALTSFTGIFAPLKDEAYFRRVAVNESLGIIEWPNGADFCPDVLYAESRPAGTANVA